MTCSLKDLPEKVRARVVNLQAEPFLIQYFMDLGIRHNVIVKVIRRLFFSSNYIIEIGDERLVLRKNEAQCLKVTTSF